MLWACVAVLVNIGCYSPRPTVGLGRLSTIGAFARDSKLHWGHSVGLPFAWKKKNIITAILDVCVALEAHNQRAFAAFCFYNIFAANRTYIVSFLVAPKYATKLYIYIYTYILQYCHP